MALPKLSEAMEIVEREVRCVVAKGGVGGNEATRVNPLDAMSRGIYGKEMAAIVEILRANQRRWSQLPQELRRIYQEECQKFQKQLEDYQGMIERLTLLQQRKTSLDQFFEQQPEKGREGGEEGTIRSSPRASGRSRATPHSRDSASNRQKPPSKATSLEDRPPFSLSFV